MTDIELIGYCEIHCETERALFSEEHINRMLELAGYPDGYVLEMRGWSSAPASVMLPLCKLARARMAAPAPAVRLNGCHNKPRPTAESTYVAQDGWMKTRMDGKPTRLPVIVEITHRMSTTCKYDMSATDAGCAGCVHGSAP